MPDPCDYSSDDDDPSSTRRSAGAGALIKSLPSAMGSFAPEPVLQRAPTTSSWQPQPVCARRAYTLFIVLRVPAAAARPAESSAYAYASNTRIVRDGTTATVSVGYPWRRDVPAESVQCASRTGGLSASVARCTLHRAGICRRKPRCKLCRRTLVCRPRGRMRESDGAILEPVRVAAARSVRTAEVLTYLAHHWRTIACLVFFVCHL
jgi:hypothetical protein